MLSKCWAVVLGAFLAVSPSILSSNDAFAGTALPASDVALIGGIVLNAGVIPVAKKNKQPVIIWNRNRHGGRCLYRIDACRYFHRGYYYDTPWWGLPLAKGGIGA